MGDSIILKVAAKSNPSSVGGAIVKNLEEEKEVSLVAVGAGAVNQSVKAIAIARGYAGPHGKNLLCIPAFTDVVIEDEEKTAMKFIIVS